MKTNREVLSAPAFRSLMAGHPSGVAVVTTLDAAGDPQGLTCSSLCSVSVEPPLLLVCIANHSRTLAALDSLGLFAVNLLHDSGRDVARHFSSGLGDRFRAVTWAGTKESGMPYLPDDAHTVAECRLHSATVAGDHTIVVGEVFSVDHLVPATPLMYGLRQYAAWPKGS